MQTLSHLQIRNPKDDETSIEATTQIFSALLPSHFSLFKRLYAKPKTYAFEIYLLNQTIYFYISCQENNETLIQSLISSSYPKSVVKKTTDPLDIILKAKHVGLGEMVLNSYYYLPIKTYGDFKIDPLTALVGYLAKQDPRVATGIQILITPASFAWQKSTVQAANPAKPAEGSTAEPMQGKSLGLKKTGFQGGKALIRLVVGTNEDNLPTLPFLQNLAGTYGTFALGEGNQFSFKKPILFRDAFVKRLKERTTTYFERKNQILNAQELATLWHPPGSLLKGVKNIAWGRTLAGEPPENLPVTDNTTDEEKKNINFFAKAEYKNKDQIFGIKAPDRRRHMYIIGKTGTGKSTLIGNMAIDDIRRDRGIGVIDPHGDLCEAILDYIPKRRLNDVIYLEPFDTERPFSLNVLEIHNAQHKDLISSGIVAIFSKLYKDSWGPRLEYILRNVILTLLEMPNATLVDVLNLLAHEGYRKRVVATLKDNVLRDFWEKEFDKMPDRMKSEAISPIQNKVGQFVQSRMIRNIIGAEKSSISLQQVMDEGKILLLNLSQGKLGEDNAALLGAMIITQIQLAAMNRSFIAEEQRRDFFLYVDEFQNFATSSFIKILSEARKYRLALTLTNQYIEQLDEEIQRAIFGNVGTLISFVVGARDAAALSKEYGGLYSETELVSLGKFEIVLKLSIDNMMTAPFPAKTLPPPSLKNDNKEKIIRLSKERYGRKVIDEAPRELDESRLEIPRDRDERRLPPPRANQDRPPAKHDGPRQDSRPPQQDRPRPQSPKPAESRQLDAPKREFAPRTEDKREEKLMPQNRTDNTQPRQIENKQPQTSSAPQPPMPKQMEPRRNEQRKGDKPPQSNQHRDTRRHQDTGQRQQSPRPQHGQFPLKVQPQKSPQEQDNRPKNADEQKPKQDTKVIPNTTPFAGTINFKK